MTAPGWSRWPPSGRARPPTNGSQTRLLLQTARTRGAYSAARARGPCQRQARRAVRTRVPAPTRCGISLPQDAGTPPQVLSAEAEYCSVWPHTRHPTWTRPTRRRCMCSSPPARTRTPVKSTSSGPACSPAPRQRARRTVAGRNAAGPRAPGVSSAAWPRSSVRSRRWCGACASAATSTLSAGASTELRSSSPASSSSPPAWPCWSCRARPSSSSRSGWPSSRWSSRGRSGCWSRLSCRPTGRPPEGGSGHARSQRVLTVARPPPCAVAAFVAAAIVWDIPYIPV